ncbi:hybrid sensor histidine kinase/response regulator [Natranaerofaba carboxydovora]|uniref:hybrid sensor histidine kinase/response regulator n=1 Tax=Natranaerofaba carboxydovora TaxID=2742683 RepID=UPI001F13761E|nr:ATP-binding protein [Natranaerofaba carboxydovora]UMZ74243.1 Sensor kinase CckA [Natranaerofaba carboxydovora]
MGWKKNRLEKIKEIIILTQFFAITLISISLIHYLNPSDFKEAVMLHRTFIPFFILLLIFGITYFKETFLNKSEDRIYKYSFLLNIFLLIIVTFVVNIIGQDRTLIKALYILPLLTMSITHGLYPGLVFASLTSINIIFFHSEFLGIQTFLDFNFDINVIFVGILFLIAWLAGRFTNLENKIRNDLINSNYALKESERKYDLLLNGTSDITILCKVENNLKLKIVKANNYFIDAVKSTCENTTGKFLHEILSERTFDIWNDKIYQALKKRKEIRFEDYYFDNHFDTKIIPTIDDKGKCTHVIITASNITYKKEIEKYRLKMEKMESIGLLAAGISHDFNNLLMVSMGNISLVKQKLNLAKEHDENVIDLLENAEKGLEKSKNLTSQLLTFTKGGTPIKNATSIKSVIEEACFFALTGSNVNCQLNIPKNIPAVEADEGQIYQVFNNIIINADQAMPEGGTVNVSAEKIIIDEEKTSFPLESGEYVKISIEDKGIGIPQKYIDKIFDPYFSTKNQGSGLGLATCHSIILKHGGYITVDSEVGIGSTFTIYLKAAKTEEVEKPNTKTIAEEKDKFKEKGRVLIMDDEEMIREVLYQTLETIGYEVACAKDGNEAVGLVENSKESFDIAMLDLTIPGGKGGKETIKELKELDPNIKAFVMSGYIEDKIIANLKDYGFEGVITKPFTVEKIKEVLKAQQ